MDYKFICLLTMTLLFLGLWILIHFRGKNKLLSKVFNIFVFNMAIWSFGLAMFYVSSDLKEALFWSDILYTAGGLIPPAFLLYSFVFTNNSIFSSSKVFLLFLPNVILFFLFFFSSLMIKEIIYVNGNKTFMYGPLHFLWDINFNVVFLTAFLKFIRLFRTAEGLIKEHLKYIILGTFVGYVLAGLTNVIMPWFGNCSLLWLGPPLTATWLFFISYTIIKHRILDIRIVIARSVIFFLVYSLILGIPVWIGFKLLTPGLWLIPFSLMGFFAILGPFIYFYIQKKAEDRLLQEQRSYHATLRQASGGMGRIKDLEKLLNMIVFVLTRTVKIDHSVVYIYDDIKKIYKLGAFKHRSGTAIFPDSISSFEAIVDHLNKDHQPIIYDEVKQKAQDYHDSRLSSIEKIMFELQATLVVPIYIEKRLIGFVGMGKKENNKLYTEDDLSVFSILSNQAALAIENAKFYEDMKVTQQQLFQAEKMATIGIMADGLSHQVNNRFHAMGFIAGDALDTIKMNKSLEMPEKLKEIMSELENALIRIQENVTQGGEVVQGLLKYTRKGEEGFSPVDVDKVISSAYEMAQFKIKSYQMSLVRDYDKDTLPKVKGNFTQLQEVFFNLIDNAYDAMMQRKNDLKEPEYQPKLTIHAKTIGNSMEMIFEDNGAGVKEEDVQKLFTPFFTTKLSSKKGTGLGLYVIRKIIEENHQGKVEFSSKFMVGTQMKIRLPLFIEK